MYNVQVNAVMFAGRKDMMKLSVPHILSSNTVDKLILCVNTVKDDDLNFIKKLKDLFPEKIQLLVVESDKPTEYDKFMDFMRFYPYINNPNNIYVKIDDDLLWMSDNFFEELVKTKLETPKSLFIYPFVINNAVCSYMLHLHGNLSEMINKHEIFPIYIYDFSVFFDEKYSFVIERLHNLFFDKYLTVENPFGILKGFPKTYVYNSMFNINGICWRGGDIDLAAKETSLVGSDEVIMSQIMPMYHRRDNIITTNALCVHYAFSGQKKYMDTTCILNKYIEYYSKIWQDNIYYQKIKDL